MRRLRFRYLHHAFPVHNRRCYSRPVRSPITQSSSTIRILAFQVEQSPQPGTTTLFRLQIQINLPRRFDQLVILVQGHQLSLSQVEPPVTSQSSLRILTGWYGGRTTKMEMTYTRYRYHLFHCRRASNLHARILDKLLVESLQVSLTRHAWCPSDLPYARWYLRFPRLVDRRVTTATRILGTQ